MGDLILVADSHLNAEDPGTDLFVRFLRTVGPTAETLILVGDIFDLWIARRGLELPFHRAVMEAAGDLARQGVPVIYVEGNRDYFVADRYAAGPFAKVVEDSLLLEHGRHRLHVTHGDRINLADRQYQRWRRFSRSAGVRWAFGLLPRGLAGRLSVSLERRFRTTNARYRIGFPHDHAARYARRAFHGGADLLVVGHFHEERMVELPGGEGRAPGRLYVLPGWREERRYLRVPSEGEPRFEPFPG